MASLIEPIQVQGRIEGLDVLSLRVAGEVDSC